MSAVIALLHPGGDAGETEPGGAALADALAQRLTGPVVVLPYDTLQRDWPRKADPTALAALTAQQAKLLSAGYVRAGYHVILHGALLDGPDGALDTLLGLMATIPGVHARRVDAAALLAAHPDAAAAADHLLDQLPPEARDARQAHR